MGLLLFVVAQASAYLTLWWLLAAGRSPQQMSPYMVGMLHASLIIALSLASPRIYHYFSARGWVADPRMWAKRIACQVRTDWVRHPSGWDIDWLRVHMRRVHADGAFYLTFALLGFQFHLRVLVDPGEAEKFREAMQKERDAWVQSLPTQLRGPMHEMMQKIPLDSNVEVSAMPVSLRESDDDDDDDDNEPVH